MTPTGTTLKDMNVGFTSPAGIECARCVVQISDNGYLVGGRTKSSGSGLYDVWLIKTDPSGNILWDKILGGKKDDVVYSLIDIGNDEYIAVGNTASYASGASDAWLLKMNKEGELLWNITIGGAQFDIGRDVIMTSDNGFMIVGETSSYGEGWNDVWLVKLDQNGSVVSNNTYGGSANEAGKSIIETDDGYLLVGTSESFGNLVEGYIVNVDLEGNLEWEKTYGGASDDYIESITKTEEGYIAVGYTTSTGTGESDVWVFSISLTGELLEETFYGGSLRDRVYQIEPTSDGGYVLVGFTWSFGSGGNGYLIKITMEEPEPEPEPEEEPSGIPGFPIIAVLIGLVLFFLVTRRT